MRTVLSLFLLALATAPSAHAITWAEITIERFRPVNSGIWIYPKEDITPLLNQEEQTGCNPAYLNLPMLIFDASGTVAEKVEALQAKVLFYAAATGLPVLLKLIGCVGNGGPKISDVTLIAPAGLVLPLGREPEWALASLTRAAGDGEHPIAAARAAQWLAPEPWRRDTALPLGEATRRAPLSWRSVPARSRPDMVLETA